MQVDFIIAPVAEQEGWRVVAIHAHSQAQKSAHRRATNGTRSAMGAAAILAHEIKNPLSGIRGAAQLLENGTEAGATALTQLICNEVDRSEEHTSELQSLMRISYAVFCLKKKNKR